MTAMSSLKKVRARSRPVPKTPFNHGDGRNSKRTAKRDSRAGQERPASTITSFTGRSPPQTLQSRSEGGGRWFPDKAAARAGCRPFGFFQIHRKFRVPGNTHAQPGVDGRAETRLALRETMLRTRPASGMVAPRRAPLVWMPASPKQGSSGERRPPRPKICPPESPIASTRFRAPPPCPRRSRPPPVARRRPFRRSGRCALPAYSPLAGRAGPMRIGESPPARHLTIRSPRASTTEVRGFAQTITRNRARPIVPHSLADNPTIPGRRLGPSFGEQPPSTRTRRIGASSGGRGN